METGDESADLVRPAVALEQASTLKARAFWLRMDAGVLRLQAQRLRDEAFLVRAENRLRQ